VDSPQDQGQGQHQRPKPQGKKFNRGSNTLDRPNDKRTGRGQYGGGGPRYNKKQRDDYENKKDEKETKGENDHQENKKKNSSKKKKKDTQEKSRIIINTKLSKLENNIECLMSSVNTIVSLEEEKDLDSASPLAGKTLDKTQEEQSKK